MRINYQSLIDQAMLNIVHKILSSVQDQGLADGQCFYISFRTNDPKVILSKNVKKHYPKEITIVLQYQYKNLQVFEDKFSVNISFNNIPETVEIPFAALTEFVDPSVNFSLQFKQQNLDDEFITKNTNTESAKLKRLKPKAGSNTKNSIRKSGKVIEIDKFRKNKK